MKSLVEDDGSARSGRSTAIHKRRTVQRVAVVGCGYWGVNHVRVLSQIEGLDVVPVDERPGSAKAAATRFRLPTHAEHLDEILDCVDAVVIATPPSSHHKLGIQAIEAGCHVLMEKPLAQSVAECDDLIAAAKERGVTLGVGHTFLFSPGVTTLAATVAHPTFGKPVHITSERLNLGLYRADVDVLWDLAPHDISILNHVLHSQPSTVACWASSRRSANYDIATLALTYLEPDVTATVHVSWLHPEKIRRVTVVGEDRMAELDDTRSQPLRIYDTAVHVSDDQKTVSYHHGDITIPVLGTGEPLLRQLTDFIDSCNHGEEPRSGGASGRNVVGVIEAAHRSVELGRPVDINQVTDGRAVEPPSPTIDLRDATLAGASAPVLQR